jgi:hypothetical protein
MREFRPPQLSERESVTLPWMTLQGANPGLDQFEVSPKVRPKKP